MPIPRTGRDYILETIPKLNWGPGRTRRSALHPIRFVGWLAEWPNFRASSSRTFNNIHWNNGPIDYLLDQGPHLHMQEHTLVGDEYDVQARISERISQPLSMVAKDQFLNFLFGGAKSVPTGYAKVPDFVVINSIGQLIVVVGEAKTPWVEAHVLGRKFSDAVDGNDKPLRKCLGKSSEITTLGFTEEKTLAFANDILGQIAKYMRDLGMKYGVLTNYEETIFLRQVVSRGNLGLEYSPVIRHNEFYDSRRGTITVRQAFLHLVTLALANPQFSTAGAAGHRQKWTERSN